MIYELLIYGMILLYIKGECHFMEYGDNVNSYVQTDNSKFLKAYNNFQNELSFTFNEESGKIVVYEARYNADGTCDIQFDNGKSYLVNKIDDKFEYPILENISEEFKEYFDKKLSKIYELKKVKDELLKKLL
jgi:hypothetical protein